MGENTLCNVIGIEILFDCECVDLIGYNRIVSMLATPSC